ncbi:hypothetical protein KJ644_04620 [Candidatus Dependentiae bacterium]|nr:hypothetical protein [Candidatus Dependentiae bacterium]MBU4387723.1 hypothetical protein [Candidatus Dependentiae bacterium]MCG2755980.1 hypothetical protein [Candidatus Dependentiae bacterium]
MKKLFIKTIFIFLFLISPAFGEKSSYSKIEKLYLPSFNPELIKQDYIDAFDIEKNNINKEKLNLIIKNKFTIPRNYTETILNLFQNNIVDNDIKKSSVKTSKKLFSNLEILCGEHKSNAHLLNKIDRTQSYAGRITLAKMLLEPTADIAELNRRQIVIKELTNTDMSESIVKFLKKYKEEEPALLNFFDANEFNKMFGSENYFPNALWFLNFIFDLSPELADHLKIDQLAGYINKSSNLLNFLNYYIIYAKGTGIYTHFNHGLLKDLKSFFYGDQTANSEILFASINILNKQEDKPQESINNIQKIANSLKRQEQANKTILTPAAWLLAKSYQFSRVFLDAKILYYEWKDEKTKYKTVKNAYEKLHKIAKIITSSQEIKNIINSNEMLKNNLSCFNEIEKFLDEKKSINKLFKQALDSLKSETFKPDQAAFLHLYFLRGKILSTAYLIAKTQENLVQFIKAIGEIDAYISIANLYKESQTNNAKYCFAQYLDQENSYINIQDFWTPFIDPNKVVTNSIILGGYNYAKCALISGPNAGGKSTILKSIILNSLLAQTITIVPANIATLTPFTYIDSYLNITDDITGGNSLFKSEVLRVKDLLSHIQNNGKSIVIGDEMFSGTNPVEGEAASCAVAKYIADLASKDNKIIALIASHYHEMTNLEHETNGIFKNYKVSANADEKNNTITYPFKLEEGASNQTVAINLMKSQGLDEKIIFDAKVIASKKNQAWVN